MVTPSHSTSSRVTIGAKFFFTGEQKFVLQGVTYGPFEPQSPDGPHLPNPNRVREDFEKMSAVGFNVLRLYHSPPAWFVDLAAEFNLKIITTIPWPLRGLFLDDRKTQAQIYKNTRRAAKEYAGHPAILGFFIDNEMKPDLVRWYGAAKVEYFLDSLVEVIKTEDPGALTAYGNFPSTEYLQPKLVDFCSYNVYLHHRDEFRAYLARLQNLAGEKPLVIGEFGMDTIRNGEEEQAKLIEEHYEEVFRGGAAGTILFSWTDEWFTGGMEMTDWAFGIVDRERKPKQSFHRIKNKIIKEKNTVVEKYPLEWTPKVSVVVCTYNGGKTLRECLKALEQLNYPDYEIIIVDDGSTDNTQEIVKDFSNVVNLLQKNMGLSDARNKGWAAARGDVIAYTDSDCMPDRDWLYYLVHSLLSGPYAAVGGPNLSPPARNWIQATVAVAPGSPSHVLLSDTVAEHVPGCNMAFHRWAMEAIGGFDSRFRKAGDDVDVCWRLIERGEKIGFSPAAVVWHHRRFTIDAYFKQQKGYGEAEALLRYKHLNYFDSAGLARWEGVIYGGPIMENLFYKPVIYFGEFGMGLFQSIYRRPQGMWTAIVGSLQWNFLTLFILFISIGIEFLRIVPLLMFGATLLAAMSYMMRVRIESKFDSLESRLLLFYLAFMQPLSRAWARYFTWFKGKITPASVVASPEQKMEVDPRFFSCGRMDFWSESDRDRGHLLTQVVELLNKEGWKYVLDNGWSDWDLQIFANRWWHIRIRTLTESHSQGRQLTRVSTHLVTNTFSLLIGTIIVGVGVTIGLIIPYCWKIEWFFVILFLAAWFFRGLQVRRRVAQLIQVAAARADLTPIK